MLLDWLDGGRVERSMARAGGARAGGASMPRGGYLDGVARRVELSGRKIRKTGIFLCFRTGTKTVSRFGI